MPKSSVRPGSESHRWGPSRFGLMSRARSFAVGEAARLASPNTTANASGKLSRPRSRPMAASVAPESHSIAKYAPALLELVDVAHLTMCGCASVRKRLLVKRSRLCEPPSIGCTTLTATSSPADRARDRQQQNRRGRTLFRSVAPTIVPGRALGRPISKLPAAVAIGRRDPACARRTSCGAWIPGRRQDSRQRQYEEPAQSRSRLRIENAR